MKKFLGAFCVITLVFIIAVSCAITLKSLRAGADLNTIFKVVDIIPVDQDGYRILSIPHKEFDKNKIEFVFFKHIPTGSYGYGMIGDNGTLTLIYDAPQKIWATCQSGFCFAISEEEARELEQEFLKIVDKDGDFTRAAPFKMRTHDIPAEKI